MIAVKLVNATQIFRDSVSFPLESGAHDFAYLANQNDKLTGQSISQKKSFLVLPFSVLTVAPSTANLPGKTQANRQTGLGQHVMLVN